MKFWLTTHWPNDKTMAREEPKQGIYLQNEQEAAADSLEVGDLVLFYETKGGKTIVKRNSDGSETKYPPWRGRMGIVTLGEVVTKLQDQDDDGRERYSDGSKKWWRHKAETRSLNSTGFVSQEDACRVLGYEANYFFLGYGNLKSGLGELSKDQFNELKALFVGETLSEAKHARKRSTTHLGGGGKGGGEGPAHKALKEAIANSPSKLLGVKGLKHWMTEHPFPTGDRIDVVLVDGLGRLQAVEVEVDCDENEEAGPLQAMKYRALLGYYYDMPVDEVETWLVARRIHPKVAEKCERFGIRWKEVPIPGHP